jgi:putative addiction module CopG family antidote
MKTQTLVNSSHLIRQGRIMAIVLKPELEQRIARQVESGRYHSADEVVQKSLDLLEAKDAATTEASQESTASVWELARRIRSQIPDEAFESVPADLSVNHDHYLYRTPKVSE